MSALCSGVNSHNASTQPLKCLPMPCPSKNSCSSPLLSVYEKSLAQVLSSRFMSRILMCLVLGTNKIDFFLHGLGFWLGSHQCSTPLMLIKVTRYLSPALE